MEAHMKNLWIVLLLCGLGLGILFAQAGSETEKERAAVRAVIDNAYIQAVYVKADATAVAEGWHPGCDIAILSREGILNKVSAYEFVRSFKQGHPPFDKNARAEYRSIEVSGYAAAAVVEVKSGDRPVYTDMLLLYKFADGWKIVSKIYYSYPKN
jgi:hypothetical protein